MEALEDAQVGALAAEVPVAVFVVVLVVEASQVVVLVSVGRKKPVSRRN